MTRLVSVCFLEYLYGREACLYLVADRTFSWVWWPLHDLDLEYYLDKREHLPGKENDGLAANSSKMPVIHLDSGWLRDIHHPDGSKHVCIRGHSRTMFGFLSWACVNYHYLGRRVNEIPKRISATQLLSGKPWKRYIRCWWPNSTECTIWWKKPNQKWWHGVISTWYCLAGFELTKMHWSI